MLRDINKHDLPILNEKQSLREKIPNNILIVFQTMWNLKNAIINYSLAAIRNCTLWKTREKIRLYSPHNMKTWIFKITVEKLFKKLPWQWYWDCWHVALASNSPNWHRLKRYHAFFSKNHPQHLLRRWTFYRWQGLFCDAEDSHDQCVTYVAYRQNVRIQRYSMLSLII